MDAIPPAPASVAVARGHARHAAGDEAGALAAFDAALAIDPDHPDALNSRALALRGLGRVADAAAALADTVRRHPDLVHAHANLTTTLLALHRPAEALVAVEAVVRLAPHVAEAGNLAGGALLALDRPAEAEAWFSRALAADPGHAQARFGRAMARLSLGRWREGFVDYEARWADPAFTADEPARAAPLWDGAASLAGRTILLHAEQGLGDTIMAARFAPVLCARGARVVLAVQTPLRRLLAPLADAVVGREDAPPPHDCRAPLMSLPGLLGATPTAIPGRVRYLFAEPAADVRGPGRNVGLVLSGSADHPDDALRSIPASACGPLGAVAGVTWHLLQPGVRNADAAALAAWPGLRRHALDDMADTARIVAAMDRVVSVDTAVAHLSGAMGVPTTVLLQHAADWRWLRGTATTAWYPSVRLVRQGAQPDWRMALEVVSSELTGAGVAGASH